MAYARTPYMLAAYLRKRRVNGKKIRMREANFQSFRMMYVCMYYMCTSSSIYVVAGLIKAGAEM